MRKLSFPAFALTAALAVSGCDIKTSADGDFSVDFASGKAEDTWSRTYKLSPAGRLELINVNGRITASPAEGAELVIEARRTAKARSDEAAKELLARLEIREEASDASVRIESRPPRLNGFSGHSIEWTIKVPKGVVLDLRTVNGGVRLNNLSNEIHAKTTNGGVHGAGILSKTVEASAVNGGIDFEVAAPLAEGDSLQLDTVNGGVMLKLPQESKATISARCVNGGVNVDELEITREQGENQSERRRRLNGTMNGGGAEVKLNTTNGGVHLVKATPGKKTT